MSGAGGIVGANGPDGSALPGSDSDVGGKGGAAGSAKGGLGGGALPGAGGVALGGNGGDLAVSVATQMEVPEAQEAMQES